MAVSRTAPSLWVKRFLPLIEPGGRVLDLAAGGGRHTRLLCDRGFAVCAVDRDVSELLPLAGPRCEVRQADLETGAGWPLGGGFDGIIVTNYLFRPLLPAIGAALRRGGALIYETFMLGNERFGRPRNPDFLLRPGELLEAFAMLTVVAFEQGEVCVPRPAVIQRLAAVAGALGRLPEAGADWGLAAGSPSGTLNAPEKLLSLAKSLAWEREQRSARTAIARLLGGERAGRKLWLCERPVVL